MNDQNTSVCWLPVWYNSAVESLYYAICNIMSYIYLIIGVIPSFFAAIVFCRKYRHAKLYIYQRVYICHTFIYGAFSMSYVLFIRQWSGSLDSRNNGTAWFRSSYVLMWYTCNLSQTVQSAAGLLSLLFLCTMALDRLLAVARPIFYKSINHKALAIALTLISCFLGIGASAYQFPLNEMVLNNDNNLYSCRISSYYNGSQSIQILSSIRIAVNVLSVMGVVALNVVTLRYYLLQKKAIMVVLVVSVRDDERERKNRRVARILLNLCFSQSLVILLGQPPVIALYFLRFFFPIQFVCSAAILTNVSELLAQICHTTHVVFLFVFNRPFRDLLYDLPLLRRFKTKTTATGTT